MEARDERRSRHQRGEPLGTCAAAEGGEVLRYTTAMAATRTVEFFETQFQRQVNAREFTLNPFEEAALIRREDEFPAPDATVKRFTTLIARKP